MQLTPEQIRTTHRGLVEWPAGPDGEALAGAVCRRLALEPDVRWRKVEDARARLLAAGPPSPQVLADVIVEQLHLAVAG